MNGVSQSAKWTGMRTLILHDLSRYLHYFSIDGTSQITLPPIGRQVAQTFETGSTRRNEYSPFEDIGKSNKLM